jgi:UDP-2,3-diacylglucosamine pyrophosphatase LpxH
MPLPQFEEIHVISDLHMGGHRGFQILKNTKRLAAYIRWVAGQRPEEHVALVLNGDIIDTLAEEGHDYILVENAEAIVRRIINDESFQPVWKALSDFIKTDLRTLVLVIGNHDLELSFPGVQQTIVEVLAGDDLSGRARIVFSTMGAGYSCMIGNSRVFCTHGNEVDAWNFNRYENLSRLARRLNAGRHLKQEEWESNAGTRMVKDVLNKVKHRYPWIDLLKPEKEAAVGVLLALDPGQAQKIDRLIPIVGKKMMDSNQVDRRLSANGFSASSSDENSHYTTVESLLGPSLTQGLRQDAGDEMLTADAMLRTAEEEYHSGTATTDPEDETLGAPGYILDRFTGWFRGISKVEALRRALKDWLSKDRSFDIGYEDDTCKNIVPTIGTGIHFIVTGHTHLERAIELGNDRFYFNCGTWIRLLRFTREMLKNEDSFKPVFKMLENCTMESIDDANFNDEDFVLDHNSAVSIGTEGTGVIGKLLHIKDDGDSVPPQLIKQFQR